MGVDIEEGHFQSFDGEEIYFQIWPEESLNALILGIHGLGEHVQCYSLLAEGLRGSGFQLVMPDLRGHGRSGGKRGVGTVDQFVLDIKFFQSLMAERYPDKPFFLLGHSMGGLVLLKLLIRHGDLGAKGVILSSPALGVVVEVPAIKKKSAHILAKIAPHITLANEIPLEHLSHDLNVVQSKVNDHWRHDRISPLLYVEIEKSISYVFSRSEMIQSPLLLQLAGDDLVVARARSEEFFEGLKTKNKTKIVYEGFYHEIYNESGRSRPIGDLKNWLSQF